MADNLIDVCHASESIVQIPNWKYINPRRDRDPDDKDFGIGFYMCETVDQNYPIELYASFDDVENVYLNEYTLNLEGLRDLRLQTNLVWVLVIAAHRHKNAGSKAVEKQQWKLLGAAIHSVVEKYDIIIGPIANDRMYSVLDTFINNKVSEEYVVEAVNFMNYPMQYVSKSDKADKRLTHVRSRELSPDELSAAREVRVSANETMKLTMVEKRRHELDAVKSGKANGRLFKDLVESCFRGIEDAENEIKLVHLEKVVEGWFENGKC